MRDCCKQAIAKIPEDEPVFCLFGRDRLARAVTKHWIALARKAGVNQDKIDRGIVHLKDFENFARAHPERMKLPD